MSPINHTLEQHCFFCVSLVGVILMVLEIGTVRSGGTCLVLIDRYISVKMFVKAASTFVESSADVSINDNWFRSAYAFASSVGTVLKWRKSLLFPTSIIPIFWSAWSRSSINMSWKLKLKLRNLWANDQHFHRWDVSQCRKQAKRRQHRDNMQLL